VQEKAPDQELYEGGLLSIRSPSIVLAAGSNRRLSDFSAAWGGSKSNLVDAGACPTTMQVEGVGFPEDEPLVLHLVRDEAVTDGVVFRIGECGLIGKQSHGAGRQRLPSLPSRDLSVTF
jgi:hypothetical protein